MFITRNDLLRLFDGQGQILKEALPALDSLHFQFPVRLAIFLTDILCVEFESGHRERSFRKTSKPKICTKRATIFHKQGGQTTVIDCTNSDALFEIRSECDIFGCRTFIYMENSQFDEQCNAIAALFQALLLCPFFQDVH